MPASERGAVPKCPPAPRPHRHLAHLAAAVVIAAMVPAAGASTLVNGTTPGALTAYATLVSAGFEWAIAGDDDSDCAVALEYRRAGDAAWKPAQPLLRVEHGIWTHGEAPGNLLAGSLFFLQPGTSYEARLTLADPDGGAEQRVVSFTTRTEPVAATLRTFHVVPGTGGGTGTPLNPFRGLAAADAVSQPGDLFVLHAGVYAGEFRPSRDGTPSRPIVWRGLDQAAVVFDGGGGRDSTSRPCVQLKRREYVFLENLSLTNCLRPLLADSTVGVVIRRCLVRPIDEPVWCRGISAATSRDLFIADNRVEMPGQWATIGRAGAYGVGGYGILVEGTGHVIWHNTIVEAWDAISLPVSETPVPAVATSNIDVYENFVDRASDDGVQADAVRHNVRIFRNRLLNTGSAVSFQPCFGGPGYVIGNEAYNCRIEPWKFHQETSGGWTQETSGLFVYHNTSVCNRHAWNETGIWRHARFRNNLFYGGRIGVPSLSIDDDFVGADFDHDGFNRPAGNATLVQWGPTACANLPAFHAASGHEQHGVEVGTNALVSLALPHHPEWNYPDGYGTAYGPNDNDLRLAANSIAIDRGMPLANIDDGFAGAAPDLGCYEYGSAAPAYGPRPATLPPLDAPSPAGGLALEPAAPTPFRGASTLAFTLAREGRAVLRIVDARGAIVRTLIDERRPAGRHAATWDGRTTGGTRAAAGLYFALLDAGGRRASCRLVLLH